MMDDSISRHAVMSALGGLTEIYLNNLPPTIYKEDAIKAVKALPSADVPHWIPCSERLPENGRTVLVTDWGETDFGKRYDGRWWNCDGDVLKDVSAWMPLPEPYKEEQHG